MAVTREELNSMIQKYMPPTKKSAGFLKAFLVGGIICTIGQGFMELYSLVIQDAETVKILTSVTLVLISAVLTAIGIYDNIAKFGGAGALVPITGFANAVVAPALDNKPEGKILGTGVQMFSIAGPVIVYGVLAANVYGIIYYIFKAVM